MRHFHRFTFVKRSTTKQEESGFVPPRGWNANFFVLEKVKCSHVTVIHHFFLQLQLSIYRSCEWKKQHGIDYDYQSRYDEVKEVQRSRPGRNDSLRLRARTCVCTLLCSCFIEDLFPSMNDGRLTCFAFSLTWLWLLQLKNTIERRETFRYYVEYHIEKKTLVSASFVPLQNFKPYGTR